MEEFLVSALAFVVAKFPVVATVMTGCRLVFKPLFTFLHAFTAATPTTKDDLLLEKAESSTVYKGFAWALDLFFSVKLPK